MAWVSASFPASVASYTDSFLLGYVNGLVGNIGISCQPGQEGVFLSTLQRRGLPENGVQVLTRLLEGRSVKLHEYQTVVQDLERQVEGVLCKRIERAHASLGLLHEEVVRALDDRGLTDDFFGHLVLEAMVHLQTGYKASGGISDLSAEFRHFVEDQKLLDLHHLSYRYLMASLSIGEEQERLQKLRRRD